MVGSIILTSNKAQIAAAGYSVESGLADNVCHFDHHGRYNDYPSPCNNPAIPMAEDGAVVAITHFDADTFVGLMRLCGCELPAVDLSLVEMIDCSGSSIILAPREDSRELCYMQGIANAAFERRFPRCTSETTDVTAIVEEIMSLSTEELVSSGRVRIAASEVGYRDCLVAEGSLLGVGKIGFWSVRRDDVLDPSRPYDDGYSLVVVYREDFKSISLYAPPHSSMTVAGKTVAGIKFEGHQKAAGSPRGVVFRQIDAYQVFRELTDDGSDEEDYYGEEEDY